MVLEYFPSLAILLASLLLVYMVVKQWKGSKSALPPGPKELPLIGNIHQLIGSSLPPHHALRDLAKKYGPVMHLKLGELTTIIISSPEAAEAALKTHELSLVQRPILATVKTLSSGGFGVIFAPYGNYWRQMRKICTVELLGAKRVQSFRPVREEEVAKFIGSIHGSSSNGGSAINMTDKIFQLTSCITSRAMFGKECNETNEFLMVVKEANELVNGFAIPELFPSLKILQFFSSKKSTLENLHLRLDKLLDNIIDDHKAKRVLHHDISGHEEGDLVDMLLNLADSTHLEFPFTTTDIKAIILDIFGAGTDTSATTTAWAMAELMKNPKVMEKAQVEVRQRLKGTKKINEEDIQELKYLKYVIKETLRLHPPVTLNQRESVENFQMGKYKIPAKARLMFNLWAIARDAKHWPDADCFRPERFHESCIDYKGTNFQYLPFGAGRRMCPGIAFGIANVELPLAQLLYHFDWKLPRGMKPEELSMTEGFGVAVNRKDPLYLIATPVCSTE